MIATLQAGWLKDADPTEAARDVKNDLEAATQSRQTLETRALRHYRLYRRWRDELPAGGRTKTAAGPTGWSKMTIPVVWTVIETILPRLAAKTPTLIVNAKNPLAQPYAQAKQLRMNHHLRESRFEVQLARAVKTALLYGDGPTKTTWDPELCGTGAPRMRALDWFDCWCSPEAATWDEAETIFHRTWWTSRRIKSDLMKRRNGDGTPAYENLDRLLAASGRGGESGDNTYQDRLQAAGIEPARGTGDQGPVAVVECWYWDGTVATITTDGTLLRLVHAPLVDQYGRPYRPFETIQDTPDLTGPYGIGEAEVQDDFQEELSTIRNQAIDQVTANINAPTVFDRTMLNAQEANEALGEPGTSIGVNGDPARAFHRLTPGQLTQDVERATTLVRQDSMAASGVSDYSTGLSTADGISNQTATGVSIITQEANQRIRFKGGQLERSLRKVAGYFDAQDRQFGGGAMSLRAPKDYQPAEGGRGATDMGNGFLRVGSEVNSRGLEYDIEIDVGSTQLPSQSQEAQKLQGFVAAAASIPPLAQLLDWRQIGSELATSHGMDPERVLMQMPPGLEGLPPEFAAMMLGGGGAPPGLAGGAPGVVETGGPAGMAPGLPPDTLEGEVMPDPMGLGAGTSDPGLLPHEQPLAQAAGGPPIQVVIEAGATVNITQPDPNAPPPGPPVFNIPDQQPPTIVMPKQDPAIVNVEAPIVNVEPMHTDPALTMAVSQLAGLVTSQQQTLGELADAIVRLEPARRVVKEAVNPRTGETWRVIEEAVDEGAA